MCVSSCSLFSKGFCSPACCQSVNSHTTSSTSHMHGEFVVVSCCSLAPLSIGNVEPVLPWSFFSRSHVFLSRSTSAQVCEAHPAHQFGYHLPPNHGSRPGPPSRPEPASLLPLAEYQRSVVGQELPPDTVRSLETLEAALDHLLVCCGPASGPGQPQAVSASPGLALKVPPAARDPAQHYVFLVNRLRAVKQELLLQGVPRTRPRRMLKAMVRMARFCEFSQLLVSTECFARLSV